MELYPSRADAALDTPADPVAGGEQGGSSGAFARSRAVLARMEAGLVGPALLGARVDAVEDYLAEAGRELQRQLLQDQLDLRARTEARRASVAGSDAVVRRRAEPGRRRQLLTRFGQVEVTRIAYRSPRAAALHVADAELALPRRCHSHPLRRQVVHEVAAGTLRTTQDALARTSGVHLGTRQLMEICTSAARDVACFYELRTQQAAAGAEPPETDGQLLVMSADGTGVSMIPAALRASVRAEAAARAADPQPPSAQLSAREKTGRRRMATVTALFDAAPAERDPGDVLPRTAAERAERRPGPKTTGRVVHASVTATAAEAIHDLFAQAHARDPQHRRRWVALVDGNNHQIERIRAEAAALGVEVTIVIDIVHVLEYCWRAAEDLHRSQGARALWVQQAARQILEGRSAQLVAGLRTLLAARTRTGAATAGIARTLAYLDAKQPYLAYHLALSLGFPIATGVIEGTCRSLVKDRLDRAGARWSLDGAEAVLLLRAVITNGDMDAFWAFHLEREYERTHAVRYPDQLALAA